MMVQAEPEEITALLGGFAKVDPQSLTDRVYTQFRERLMRGERKPHQRLRIRDVARELGTSETPVREAVFQLVRDNALVDKT